MEPLTGVLAEQEESFKDCSCSAEAPISTTEIRTDQNIELLYYICISFHANLASHHSRSQGVRIKSIHIGS